MAYAQGIDFRQTSTYVTDPANCYPEISTTANYPTTPSAGNATAVGWEQAPTGTRNRSATVDPRLAGIAFTTGTTVKNYRIDLPAPGDYTVTLAIGDEGSSEQSTIAMYDDTTLLTTIGTDLSSAAGSFYDATATEYTAANWPSENTPITLTFASAIMRLAVSGGTVSANGTIAHVFVEGAGGGGITASGAFAELADALAGTGGVLVSGTSALTELADTTSSAGKVLVAGTAALTEINDAFAGAGTIASGIAGSASMQELVDTLSGTGAILVSGTAALRESVDAFAAESGVLVSGSAALQELDDIFAGSGLPPATLVQFIAHNRGKQPKLGFQLLN